MGVFNHTSSLLSLTQEVISVLENLKLLRKEKGISQQLLANAIGCSQQSINKYENHNIEPDIDTLIRIADYFETSVDFLIGHTEVRQKIEPVQTFSLNESEGTLLTSYRSLNQKQRRAVKVVIESYLEYESKNPL